MKTIWKFPVVITNRFNIDMPRGAQLLDVQFQNEGPFLWAVVQDDGFRVPRQFAIVGTGSPMPGERHFEYVGTFQCGTFVWHLFDLGEIE